MTHLFDKGLSYNCIAVARSAVGMFISITSGNDLNEKGLITRFMKGIFNKRPIKHKNQNIWDVKIVLSYLEKQNETTLLQLSCKLCMLYLLLTAQRCQSLHLIELCDIEINESQLIINTGHIIKQSRPGYSPENIILHRYDRNSNLCIVSTMNEYLRRTRALRNSDKLLISTIKPFRAASKQTVGRWIKLVMINAGVNDSFTPHSTRSASTSMAKLKGVPISRIIQTAGWSNAKTFATFYDKPIRNEGNGQIYSVENAVLNANM